MGTMSTSNETPQYYAIVWVSVTHFYVCDDQADVRYWLQQLTHIPNVEVLRPMETFSYGKRTDKSTDRICSHGTKCGADGACRICSAE